VAIRITNVTGNSRKLEFSAYASMDDGQLLALFRCGDERAFQALMNRHRGIIWRVVRQYLGQSGAAGEADDIFQDICLSFCQNQDAYQSGAAKFSSWLYRVAVNKCLDVLRSRKGKLSATELDNAIPSLGQTAEDLVAARQLSELVKNMLGTLPEQQRLALSLYYIHEYDMASISARMDVTEEAARALIKRGRNNLRDKSGMLPLAVDYT
jgi:RNA polymerase sigma-70 factor (ECF subfamily)